MNEEEDLLHRMPLASPSEALDRRVRQLLREAPGQRRNPLSYRISLWQCAAACLACAAIAFLVASQIHGREAETRRGTETRWTVETQVRPFDVFDWTTYPKDAAPRSAIKARQMIIEPPGKDTDRQEPHPPVLDETRDKT